MKRFGAIAIALAIIFTAAGCKPAVSPTATEAAKSSEAKMDSFKFEASRNAALGSTDFSGVYNSFTGTFSFGKSFFYSNGQLLN